MKEINWKLNTIFKMEGGSSIAGLENDNFLLKRKKGVEIPTMKAKNIVQLKKTDNKKKK